MTNWISEITTLSWIRCDSTSSVICGIHIGLKNRWIYFLRTLADIQDWLETLESAISRVFTPAITDRLFGQLDRDILALPVRLGGLGVANPSSDTKAIPIKCFRFPSLSLSWRWVGRSGKKKKKKKRNELRASEGRAAKYESSFVIRWYNGNRTTKCLKRLQKRSIDYNLRQLVLMRQDRVLVKKSTCFFISDFEFFFFYFSKKNVPVGRWETKTFMGKA